MCLFSLTIPHYWLGDAVARLWVGRHTPSNRATAIYVWGMPGLARHDPLQGIQPRPTAGCVWADLRVPCSGFARSDPPALGHASAVKKGGNVDGGMGWAVAVTIP